MSTKSELEAEVVSLRAQLKDREDKLQTARWNANAQEANANYHKAELARNSDAWTKKYLRLEESSAKAMSELVLAGLDALKIQREGYEAKLKELIHRGDLAIEQARTDTLADAFAHVVDKLKA